MKKKKNKKKQLRRSLKGPGQGGARLRGGVEGLVQAGEEAYGLTFVRVRVCVCVLWCVFMSKEAAGCRNQCSDSLTPDEDCC